MQIPFQLGDDNTQTIAATTASTSLAAAMSKNSQRVRILNAGPNIAFIRLGVFAQTITADATKDLPLEVGVARIFTKNGLDGAAAICATGTATVYLTPGEGV